MSSGIYNVFKSAVMQKGIDLVNDTIKVALLNSSHSFDPSAETNSAWADVSANEVSGTNYVAGGVALGSKAVTVDNPNNRAVFDAADASWSSATVTAYHAVIYDDSTTPKYLIASLDFGAAKTSTNGTFTIEWSTDGILTIS